MNHRVLVYVQKHRDWGKIRLLLEKSFPDNSFTFSQHLQDINAAVSVSHSPKAIIFCLSESNKAEEANITNLFKEDKLNFISKIVIFDEGVDLSVFNTIHVDALLSSGMKESMFPKMLLPFVGHNNVNIIRQEGNDFEVQNHFNGLMESASAGIWCLKPEQPFPIDLPEEELIKTYFNSTCVECNGEYAKMLGSSVDDIIGLKLDEILPKTDETIKFLKTFIRSGFKITDGVSHELTPEGEERYFSKSFVASIKNGFIYQTWGTQTDVSESKMTMDALRETERQVTTMIENLPGIAYQCKNDENWTMKFISKNVFELTGYPSEDFIENKNITFNDIIFADDRDFVRDSIEKPMLNKSAFQIEYRIITKSNKVKWVREQGREVQVQGSSATLLEGLIFDITEKKMSEIRLEIMQNIGEAANQTNDLTELIELIEKELGKAVNTRNFLIALYDEQTDRFSLPYMKDEKDHFDAIPAYNTISALVVRQNKSMLLKSSDIEWLESSGEIKRVGSPAKCWLGVPLKVEDKVTGIIVLQDYEDENAIGNEDRELIEFISTQVAATIFKKQADEEIRRLYQSIQQSPVSVVITDTKGKIIYVNRKFIDVTGYTREEAEGNTFSLIKSGKTTVETYKNLWQTITAGKEWQGEFLNRKKDGELFWESASISPVKNSKKEITHFISVKEDITSRKDMEQDLIDAKDKAEESDRLKTAFLANMSHEIRTPMNAIIGFTEMLDEGDYQKEERRKFSQLIIENGRRLLNIIDDIIDIAKIEAGQLSIATDRCSANKILFDNYYSFKELRSKLGKEHIEIQAKQFNSNQNFIFSSDPRRISQVISNLMNNALKYTYEGSIELGYEIHNGQDGNFIDFYVKDTGIGIQAENIEKIFDRFRQLDDSSTREFGGTGLGLAISKNIARLLNGEIIVSSSVGKGSSFHLILPFVEVKQDRFEPAKKEILIKKPDWSNKKILIAEDEDSNFHLLEIMLRKTKVKIIRAYNGKEAIDFIRGGKDVDLILMDMRMPLMDGYEATTYIKRLNPDIPIVAQTAYALSGDREVSMNSGCDDYVSKPIKMEELFGIVTKFFD